METDGAWFVVFPTWRMPDVPEVERAIKRLAGDGVDVTGEGLGPFVVGDGEHVIEISIDDAPPVLIEAGELAESLDVDDQTRTWLATCDARFVLAFSLGDRMGLLDALIMAGERLRKITGGAVVDATKRALLDPPVDNLTLPQTELASELASYARGGDAAPDVELLHYATAAHVTLLTRARVDGDVEICSVMRDRPRQRARVKTDVLRAAAAALVASGFPKLALPAGAAPARSTSPIVRLGVARDDLSITAELAAAQIGLVPAFKNAVRILGGLGDSVRAAARAMHEALVGAREGRWPYGLAVEVRFEPLPGRSFALHLGSDGILMETERRDDLDRNTALGLASTEEKKAIAAALLDAGFPDHHGQSRAIEGPCYTVAVELGEGRIEVIVPAEELDEHAGASTIEAVYAAAIRFGTRPLELVAGA